MAKPKLDFKKILGTLTSRFEILGLLIAGVLVAVCLLMGLMTFLSASSPEPEILASVASLQKKKDSVSLPEKIQSPKADPSWSIVTSKDAQLVAPVVLGIVEGPNNLARVQPMILGLDSDPKQFQMDFIVKGICQYEVNKVQEEIMAFGDSPNVRPVVVIGVKRLVVVSGTFSYNQQVEQYCKALRIEKVGELFDFGLAPTFEGFNVDRRKIIYKDGKEDISSWEPLYAYNTATEKVEVHKSIENLLRDSFLDERQIDKLIDVIHGPSLTPLPRLMDNADYPDVVLPGITGRKQQNPPPDKLVKDPSFAQQPNTERFPAGTTRQSYFPKSNEDKDPKYVKFDKLPEALKMQLSGDFNWVGPYGTFPPQDIVIKKDVKADTSVPPPPGAPDPKDAVVQIRTNNRTRQSPPVNDKALVRFVDVDVEPGAEYQYRIQLRFSNPNYGQDPSIVSYPGLAKDKVLQLSPAVETPRVKIPANTDHKFYITNIDAYQQKSFVNRINSAKSIDRLFTKELLADKYVPFQVHAFIEKVEEPNKPSRDVADWVVAERLLVARGELIGRDCEVELRIWNKRRAQWDFVGGPAGLAKPGTKISGVVVPFQPKPPVVLLDFVGGKQYYKTPKGADFFEDSATEALVLMPDLTMKLRNARDDAEARSEPTSDYRHTFDQWKTRLEDARNAQKAPDKGGR